ncbi:MAG TPA: TetR family transcriptional regulator [Solirubrobacteraceae bacterium]|nr:TetR family transcriptional regulator [Solirubrobacteraceae bacterium]
MARVVAEHGAGSATVSRVVSRAGVSRRTFYEQFSGCEDCFQAVFEDAVERASAVATAAAVSAPPGWREQVRAGLAALLGLFDEEPAVGSLLVVDALGAGLGVLERRARVLEALTAVVDRGRSEARGRRASSSSPPPLTAEGVVGAVLSVIHGRMLEQGAGRSANGSSRSPGGSRPRRAPGPLLGMLNSLMAIVVLPYLGQAAAAKELARPVPKASRAPKSSRAPRGPSGDPLAGLNMRLTYRTLVVLSAIGADPGASNRRIADAAGVHDQGQISKLLGRLEKLGLIRNTGAGQSRGEPNAWALTTRGREVQRAIGT